MLFDGKRPARASSPPFLRLRVRPGQVVAVDQPVGQCDQTSVGYWWEDATVTVLDRRSRPALGRGVEAVGFAGASTPQRQPKGFVWPRTVVPVSEWESRIVRLRFDRRGHYGLLGGASDVGYSTAVEGTTGPSANPPADLSDIRYEPKRNPYLVGVTVAGRPVQGGGGGGSLGARARVYLQTCARAGSPLLARSPSRRVRRSGRPRVRLQGRKRVCSARRRLTRRAATRALAAPRVPPPDPAGPPVPAGCLLSLGAQPFGIAGTLISRTSFCSRPAIMGVQAVVIVLTPGGKERRVVGSGRVALVRRFDLAPRGTGTLSIALGYQGTAGIIKAIANFEVRARCEFAFRATCAALPQGPAQQTVRSGATASYTTRLVPGALPGRAIDYLQPWIELRLRAFLQNSFSIAASISEPRARCDSRATRRQACVFDGYTPTLSFPSSRLPEIAAHVRQAQAAGQPGAPGKRVLTRAGFKTALTNRRRACPDALRDRYRRARPEGSCDEYPFASAIQGGAGSSTANVPRSENNAQGGFISTFYRTQRVLDGDSYWVTTSP